MQHRYETLFELALASVLIGTLCVGVKAQRAEAIGTIYIRADGNVDPPTAPIQRDGNFYTLTDNITSNQDGIIIERNNIILDGLDHTITSILPFSYVGIYLSGRENVTVTNFQVRGFDHGVFLQHCSGNSILTNRIISNNMNGICLTNSSNNKVTSNVFINNGLAVELSYHNLVENNTVNGKPLIYLEDAFDYNVSHAGQVILVNCDNIVIEGLDLSNATIGVQMDQTKESVIANNTIRNNRAGITLWYSMYNTIAQNDVALNDWGGIWLYGSPNNTIIRNNLTANSGYGIYCQENCSIIENTIARNSYEGIYIDSKLGNNRIYRNNLVDNNIQVLTIGINPFDDGVEGNYWSDYNGTDSDHDGIGDSPYIIDANNQDNNPLMGMFSDFTATPEYHVQIICNSTVSNFQFNGTAITFNVSGENGTTGFCRICIPTALMNVTYKVFINGTEVSHTLLPCSNSTHSHLYFTYNHSTQEVIIIPEFPSLIILPLFMIATLLAVIVYRRKHLSTRR